MIGLVKNPEGVWMTEKDEKEQRTRIWTTQVLGWNKQYQEAITNEIYKTEQKFKEESEEYTNNKKRNATKLGEENTEQEKTEQEDMDITYCEKYEMQMKINKMHEEYIKECKNRNLRNKNKHQEEETNVINITSDEEEEVEIIPIQNKGVIVNIKKDKGRQICNQKVEKSTKFKSWIWK